MLRGERHSTPPAFRREASSITLAAGKGRRLAARCRPLGLHAQGPGRTGAVRRRSPDSWLLAIRGVLAMRAVAGRPGAMDTAVSEAQRRILAGRARRRVIGGRQRRRRGLLNSRPLTADAVEVHPLNFSSSAGMTIASAIEEGEGCDAVAREVRTEGAMTVVANASGQVQGANMTGWRGAIATATGAAMRPAGAAALAKGIKYLNRICF
jgi:hypothetical protein